MGHINARKAPISPIRRDGGAAAVLDLNLAGEPTTPLADALAARGVPLLAKPFAPEALLDALAVAVRGRGTAAGTNRRRDEGMGEG